MVVKVLEKARQAIIDNFGNIDFEVEEIQFVAKGSFLPSVESTWH